MQNLQQSVEAILDAIPGSLAVSIAEIESGMCLASKSKDSNLEPELAAAYNAEVVKQKTKAKMALGLGDQQIEDILITLTNQYHVLTILPGNVYFIYTATNRETNLAIIRNVIRKHVEEISKQIG
jgi:predicted regulator of Ras-like GTPase activity (Roadblock/LC7/MglB family)